MCKNQNGQYNATYLDNVPAVYSPAAGENGIINCNGELYIESDCQYVYDNIYPIKYPLINMSITHLGPTSNGEYVYAVINSQKNSNGKSCKEGAVPYGCNTFPGGQTKFSTELVLNSAITPIYSIMITDYWDSSSEILGFSVNRCNIPSSTTVDDLNAVYCFQSFCDEGCNNPANTCRYVPNTVTTIPPIVYRPPPQLSSASTAGNVAYLNFNYSSCIQNQFWYIAKSGATPPTLYTYISCVYDTFIFQNYQNDNFDLINNTCLPNLYIKSFDSSGNLTTVKTSNCLESGSTNICPNNCTPVPIQSAGNANNQIAVDEILEDDLDSVDSDLDQLDI